jgi:hypothetical protein
MRGKGFGQVDVLRLLEHVADHAFDQGHDLFFAEEGGFQVDLGEFGLAVGAQVLVAEALGQLEVAVVAGHHQQLLEQLRRLRQGVEHAVMDPRRHQVVARAFRGAARQHGRFDFQEAVVVEVVAHQFRDAVAQAHVLLHRLAAQVEIAVLQADVFVDVVVVDLEGRRQAGVEDLQRLGQHLDHAGGQIRVLGAGRPGAHFADHLEDEFRAGLLGQLEGLRGVRVDDHLDRAFTVAQVDEDDPAVVAAAMRPAAQGDDVAGVRAVDGAAVMGTHG